MVGITTAADHCIILWQPAHVFSGEPITRYNLNVFKNGHREATYRQSAESIPFYNITNLTPGMMYEVFLNAESTSGIGFNTVISVKTPR